MAAIIEPRRISNLPPQRPALRLVTADGGRTVSAPLELGLGPAHVAAAIAALVFALLLSLAIGNGALAGLAPGPSSSSAAGAAATATTTHVEVQAGDTYWSIARRLQPTGDVRPLVDRLLDLNGTTVLQPGAQILVPR